MSLKHVASNVLHCLRLGITTLALFQFTIGGPLASSVQAAPPDNSGNTTSPIKHVIVIIGENRSFDHVFATYVPKTGQKINNLLSEKIVNADGTPGPNFALAHQQTGTDSGSDAFLISADPKGNFPNDALPAPLTGGPRVNYVPTLADALTSENGLDEAYYGFLTTGGTGQDSKVPDERITNVNTLPAGPFQLTGQDGLVYDSYAASPVHRFYQMWQQLDCSASHGWAENPSGCTGHSFAWVEVTVGAGTNGVKQAANFSTQYSPTAKTTGEGSTAMGFYNVQNGDAPYFKLLADTYSMSDNFHQSVDGGTGANHIMLGHGDAIWFSDGAGHAKTPPQNVVVQPGTINAGVVSEIENPRPAPGTNNWYIEDGYGGGSYGSPSFGGGSYSMCADPNQAGVSSVTKYLQSLAKPIDVRCEAGHYYLLNNYNPGYFGNGNNAFTDTNPANPAFTIPPSSVPSIGDTMLKSNVSWKYYGDQWNNYVNDPYQLNYGAVGANADDYCNICNPFQYDTSIMADATIRTAHIQDTTNLYADIQSGALPAVSFVKPSGLVDGHPASSKLDLFEGFTKKIVDEVMSNPTLAANTAIFITFDEGGGYYDSGYVQPLDFFGDGTRIPMIVVSAYSKGGTITHNYSDHVSILKFIERNWSLPPVTSRSRDNFPNPVTSGGNVYVPTNTPAISDLFELFSFPAATN
ncbi:MAG TPA: alkaline phosphatase family protein [Candidatus Acidoferrales bacterium]